MTIPVKVSGTYHNSVAVYARVAGVWKIAQSCWTRVSGVWKLVFPAVALPTSGNDAGGGASTITITLDNGGGYSTIGLTSGTNQSGNWVAPAALTPGAYTIRAHQVSGTAVTGSALDADLALTATRSWTLSRGTLGTNVASILLTLKDGAGNTLLTSTVNLQAQVV